METADRAQRVATMRTQIHDDMITIEMAAQVLGKSTRTIRRMLENNQLRGVKIGVTPYVVASEMTKSAANGRLTAWTTSKQAKRSRQGALA